MLASDLALFVAYTSNPAFSPHLNELIYCAFICVQINRITPSVKFRAVKITKCKLNEVKINSKFLMEFRLRITQGLKLDFIH